VDELFWDEGFGYIFSPGHYKIGFFIRIENMSGMRGREAGR
jgi:hypothetical protein